jgi:hypothetical protein
MAGTHRGANRQRQKNARHVRILKAFVQITPRHVIAIPARSCIAHSAAFSRRRKLCAQMNPRFGVFLLRSIQRNRLRDMSRILQWRNPRYGRTPYDRGS